ncbi:MAG: hypothetical protein J3Q66DRAFT_375967 [Benniella sp.]|nr:MAG: hypothetical protein J3Q66DRAFT_375967 [Benniella sp.]
MVSHRGSEEDKAIEHLPETLQTSLRLDALPRRPSLVASSLLLWWWVYQTETTLCKSLINAQSLPGAWNAADRVGPTDVDLSIVVRVVLPLSEGMWSMDFSKGQYGGCCMGFKITLRTLFLASTIAELGPHLLTADNSLEGAFNVLPPIRPRGIPGFQVLSPAVGVAADTAAVAAVVVVGDVAVVAAFRTASEKTAVGAAAVAAAGRAAAALGGGAVAACTVSQAPPLLAAVADTHQGAGTPGIAAFVVRAAAASALVPPAPVLLNCALDLLVLVPPLAVAPALALTPAPVLALAPAPVLAPAPALVDFVYCAVGFLALVSPLPLALRRPFLPPAAGVLFLVDFSPLLSPPPVASLGVALPLPVVVAVVGHPLVLVAAVVVAAVPSEPSILLPSFLACRLVGGWTYGTSSRFFLFAGRLLGAFVMVL